MLPPYRLLQMQFLLKVFLNIKIDLSTGVFIGKILFAQLADMRKAHNGQHGFHPF
jgi:hypothetical protein